MSHGVRDGGHGDDPHAQTDRKEAQSLLYRMGSASGFYIVEKRNGADRVDCADSTCN